MKKLVSILLVLAVMISVSSLTLSAQDIKRGDVDFDGIVSITDATLIQLYLAGMENFDFFAKQSANVDGDESLSVMDATCVQMYLAQHIDKFPSDTQKPSEPSFDDDGYNNQIVKP